MKLDWAEIIQIGLGEMNLKPSTLWSLSPVEFWIMAGLIQKSQSPCLLKHLNALQQKFPDR